MHNKNQKTSIGTFSIKVFFLVVLFFGFPYILITQFNKYQTKASGIIEQQNTIVEIQSNKAEEIKVLTQDEARTLGQIHEFIKGTWVSEFDGKYKIIVDENNKFEEYYDNEKEGFGTWRVFSSLRNKVALSEGPAFSNVNEQVETSDTVSSSASSSSLETENMSLETRSAYTKSQFENEKVEDPKYFFQKQQFEPSNKGEIYIYQIQQLDTQKFVLVFKNGSGKPLVFVKENSTAI